MLYIILLLWMAYWSAESGASLPWSQKWQDIKGWYSEVPEAISAITIATVGVTGWYNLIGFQALYVILGWVAGIALAYAGIQSATWAYLRWKSHKDPNTTRSSTLKPLNDFIGKLFGYRLGDEGYSWIWAATKGFITTIPVGGIGLITFPLGNELGSHAEGRLPGDPNMWKELAGGLGLGLACVLWLILT